jgi:PAS domain S-box-containing protein
MNAIYDYSIKRKVMTVILLACFAVSLVTVVAFVLYDVTIFKQSMVRNLVSQSRLIAENSSAALAFNDQDDAKKVLASLRSEPDVVAAAIYDQHGRLFANYPAGNTGVPPKPEKWAYKFQNHSLCIYQPVVYTGEQLGTIYLQSNLGALTQRLRLYTVISLLILLVSLLVAILLSNMLQRRISRPIVALAKTARAISLQQDYSIRAGRLSNDELGLLTDSFNNMLDRIQNSDSALRAREAQFRFVTNQAPVLLAHLDSEYRYKFVNKPYASIFGREPEEIVGMRAVEVVGAAQFEAERSYMEKVLAGDQIQFELEMTSAQNEQRWSHVEYTPEKDSDGRTIGFVAVHTDVTLRKRAEMDMQQARDQALAASRAKDNFLAALSHELRTPLNPVLLIASDAAGDKDLPATIRRNFEIIGKNVELEARLIDDLLDLTRIARGKLHLKLQKLNLNEIVQDVISHFEAEVLDKQIELCRDLKAAPATVEGDAVRLHQILWNILKNAVKFTPNQGKISISTQTQNKVLHIQIMDTGIGITPEELERVFDAFSQGDHATENSHRFGGLGLGLAITRQLVEMHRGKICARSKGRDKGACFEIQFPGAWADHGAEPAGVLVVTDGVGG